MDTMTPAEWHEWLERNGRDATVTIGGRTQAVRVSHAYETAAGGTALVTGYAGKGGRTVTVTRNAADVTFTEAAEAAEETPEAPAAEETPEAPKGAHLVTWTATDGTVTSVWFAYPHTARAYTAWRANNPDAPHSAWVRTVIYGRAA